jgi:hypothetical protein
MISLEAFDAEISTTFANYAETGDISSISIKMWVIHCLRQMGNNITDLRETIVDVKGSKANLPDSFKSLKLALKLNPDGYKIDGNRNNVENSYIYKQRIENPAWFDVTTHEYVTSCDTKIVTEKILLGGEKTEFYYKPEWLSLTKGIKKDILSSDCQNIHPSIRNSYPHEINITGHTLNANFREGQIYIQYNSLPTDEDGEIVIPEITTGDLYHYIENYVKTKLAEYLILNQKNPTGIAQLIPLWEQKLPQLKAAALRECKFSSFSKGWEAKFAQQNKRNIDIYTLPSF